MRRVIVALVVFGMLAATGWTPSRAAPLRPGELGSREAILGWMNGYRAKREPAHVPEAVQAMSKLGLLKDSENAGVFVGFMAGIIGTNPGQAEVLIGKMFPLPPEDQWALVQAIAYSGLPDWKGVLGRVADRMPSRSLMIGKYLKGELATLDQAGFEKNPGAFAKLGGYLGLDGKPKEKKAVLAPSPALLDLLWGYYCATGEFNPAVSRLITLLSWSTDRDDVDKLTLGGMAKYTLAANAARDPKLLAMLKSVAKHYPKDMKAHLDEVIEAAETVDFARLRKNALASIEELKRKGPGSKRDISFWGQVGEGTLALGCIAAAALGQVEFGIPCVVGGAMTSAGLRFWDPQK
ncbi:MAG: hypothetical protein QOK01_63 [Alphaproteobacteria bacterium]|jgi:hypothetical protein|nr:hypothetical protein [Alphaproteobacteria bacterium]